MFFISPTTTESSIKNEDSSITTENSTIFRGAHQNDTSDLDSVNNTIPLNREEPQIVLSNQDDDIVLSESDKVDSENSQILILREQPDIHLSEKNEDLAISGSENVEAVADNETQTEQPILIVRHEQENEISETPLEQSKPVEERINENSGPAENFEHNIPEGNHQPQPQHPIRYIPQPPPYQLVRPEFLNRQILPNNQVNQEQSSSCNSGWFEFLNS